MHQVLLISSSRDPSPPWRVSEGQDVAGVSVASWVLAYAHWCNYEQHHVFNWKRSTAGCVPVHPNLEAIAHGRGES